MPQPTTIQREIARFRRDIEERIRLRSRSVIEAIFEEELTEALGCGPHDRTAERRGYRHGAIERTITTETGPQRLQVPRGRILHEDGTTEEFRSEILPRYARRTRKVDEAILRTYLAGANSRRIRKALEPLLGESNLSKSAISRVVSRLKGLFVSWCDRELSDESYAVLYLDGFHLKVRLARRVVSVPVLAALGVAKDGTKRLVGLELATRESGAAWCGFIQRMIDRGLAIPRLIVSDGHAGLKKLREVWGDVAVQRCTWHKRANLLRHCPKHAHSELMRDYGAIVGADDQADAAEALDAFLKKWTSLCPPVARSLREAGLDLLTFYRFPKAMWKGLRTTNSLENLNREFRRRTKTQGSFGTEAAAVTLLYGLVAFGQITLRKITGYKHVAALMEDQAANVA